MPIPRILESADQASLTIWQWPFQKGRPSLHWAHATGFHGRSYAPLLDNLSRDFNLEAWDMRGHGESRATQEGIQLQSWEPFYQDLVVYLESLSHPVWLGGHSIGGMASLAAARRMPQKVLGLLLVEPVVLDPFSSAFLAGLKALKLSPRISYASRAANRQPSFPSREAAFQNYRDRNSFRRWSDTWLQAYVDGGFFQKSSEEVALACTPEWESSIFARTEHWPWKHVPRAQDCPPLFILAGAKNSTFPPAARWLLQRKLPRAHIQEVPDSTHFLPMEHTEFVQEWLAKHLRQEPESPS